MLSPLRVVLSFEEFGHARNPNFLAMYLEQPAIRQVVQNPGEVFLGDIEATDRKFNRMRPSMARVLGLETRSAKEG